MSTWTPRKVDRELAGQETGVPPADLLAKLRAEIPPDVGSRLPAAARREAEVVSLAQRRMPRRRLQLLAASLIVTLAGGAFAGLVVLRHATPPAAMMERDAVQKSPAKPGVPERPGAAPRPVAPPAPVSPKAVAPPAVADKEANLEALGYLARTKPSRQEQKVEEIRIPQEVAVPAPQAAPAPPPPPPAPEPSIVASQEAADSLREKAAAPGGVAGGAAAAEAVRIAPRAEGAVALLPRGKNLRLLRVEAGTSVRFVATVARWRPLGDNLYEVELTPQAAAEPAAKIADLSGAGEVRVSDLAGAWKSASVGFRIAALAATLADTPTAAEREQLLLLARQLAAETAGQPAGAAAAELVRRAEKAQP